MASIYQRSPDHPFYDEPAPNAPHYHGWAVHQHRAMFVVPLRFATAPGARDFFRRRGHDMTRLRVFACRKLPCPVAPPEDSP